MYVCMYVCMYSHISMYVHAKNLTGIIEKFTVAKSSTQPV